jgi:hypothetical protein
MKLYRQEWKLRDLEARVGRAAERERGTLVMLTPGQVMEYLLTLTILEE